MLCCLVLAEPHVGRLLSLRQAAVSRDPPIPPGIPLVVFGIICNPYTSFILKLFSDLGVGWTRLLGRRACGEQESSFS